MSKQTKKNSERSRLHLLLTIIGWVLCIVLIPMLILNCTLLVKGFIDDEKVPDIGGVMPLIVLTDSMHPQIQMGDLIFCKTIDAAEVEVGDVISFFDPAGNGTAVVTHQVIEIVEEEGVRSFRTKGINNNTEDRKLVPAESVFAEYSGIRIPGAGNAALFMQSTTGLLVCVVLPIILLVGYDFIRRRIYEKSKTDDVEALKAELEALRALQNEEKSE